MTHICNFARLTVVSSAKLKTITELSTAEPVSIPSKFI